MPEENGVIHGNGELKDGRKSFGEVRNFAEEEIGTEIIDNHNTDAGEEKNWSEPVIKESKHNN